tara:strand:- start:8526 stop:9290 length:765 start_codon:yes stop_codon:yes gene_type:complete
LLNQTKILLSDFLHRNVRCNKGLDHGPGVMGWMHPPVHRILGWITRPSSLRLTRDVWRLNQLHVMSPDTIYVKGEPSFSDQETLDRFPTLIQASLLNNNGDKLGSIADLVFDSISGKILYYLVSRTNPKIPGTSRWSLKIEQIKDQQPGMILTDFHSIDDMPLLKASFREELMQKTKNWRSQIEEITNRASNKLEGWLEDSSLDDINFIDETNYNSLNETDDWIDIENIENKPYFNSYPSKKTKSSTIDGDPWI